MSSDGGSPAPQPFHSKQATLFLGLDPLELRARELGLPVRSRSSKTATFDKLRMGPHATYEDPDPIFSSEIMVQLDDLRQELLARINEVQERVFDIARGSAAWPDANVLR